MRVLITGGTGFIGSRLALRCLERGDAVTVLGQLNTPAEVVNRDLVAAAGASVVVGSVTDRRAVDQAARDANVVFHLAAAQHEAGAPDEHFKAVNVEGVRTVLEASVVSGAARVVHGSTIGVYRSRSADPISERSPLEPDNIYGVTKLEGEAVARQFGDRVGLVIVRISETYGPGDRRLLKLFRAIQRGRFVMLGAGANAHHPIFVDDLVDALVLSALSDAAVDHTIVAAGKEVITTAEMVRVIAAELGVAPPRHRLPLGPALALGWLLEVGLSPFGVTPPVHRRRLDFFRKSITFSTHDASTLLGFVPKWGFAAGVERTARHYRTVGDL